MPRIVQRAVEVYFANVPMPAREEQLIEIPCFTDHRGTLSVIDVSVVDE